MNMRTEIIQLKTSLQSEKMLNGRLRKKLNGDHNPDLTPEVDSLTTELGTSRREVIATAKRAAKAEAAADRLSTELEASRRECGNLVKNEAGKDLEINDLRDQAYHFQQLIAHTAAVSVWKVLE